MARVTLESLYQLVESNHAEVTTRLGAVEVQVKTTNGRVKDLEREQIKRLAVEEYKASTDAKKTDKRRFDTTTLIQILLLFATFVAALWWLRG